MSRRLRRRERPSSVPPPGVSSTSISPPIASTKPSRDREAEADAVAASAVAEPLERLEHALAVRGRDARAAVDDPQVDVAADRAGLDARRGSLGRRAASALSTTLASARSSSAGSA